MSIRDFGKAFNGRRQISTTVTGRRTGRPTTIPVWFVSDDRAVWLLPVQGSKTQWFRNLQKKPRHHRSSGIAAQGPAGKTAKKRER